MDRRRLTRCAVLSSMLIMVFALAGCETAPITKPSSPDAIVSVVDVEEVRSLLNTHNQRVAQLDRVETYGVVELRWVDDKGKSHVEPQVNTRLWIELPSQTGLRAEKLGEVLFWIGSDAERSWLFDMTGDERVLYLHSHGEPLEATATASPLLVRPLALLDLLGLTDIDPDGSATRVESTTSADGSEGYRVTAPGRGGVMRMYFTAGNPIPVGVETLDDSGEIALTSVLGRPRSVELPGVSRIGLPKMPTLIDIADQGGTVAIKLALDEPARPGPDAPWDRVFDLDRLRTHLRPQRVVGAE